MKGRSRISPLPLVLGALLAVAALAFGSGSGTPAKDGARVGTRPTASSPSPSPTPAAPKLPSCGTADRLAPNAAYDQWRTTLLDTLHRLPPGYVPPDLVSTATVGFGSRFEIRKLAIGNLAALATAAEAAGHPLALVAGYRSFEQQRELLKLREKQLAPDAAKRVARPGHSEHQLGTAVDFTSKGMADVNQQWGSSATGRWVAQNAWRYGFVLSYPKGRIAVTCYPYEPWHFRYVGPKLAARVHASGLTLREYLWRFAVEQP